MHIVDHVRRYSEKLKQLIREIETANPRLQLDKEALEDPARQAFRRPRKSTVIESAVC